MAVKLTRKCTRCRREDEIQAESLETAQRLESETAEKEKAGQSLRESLEQLDGALPDLVVLFQGQIVVHPNLCLQNSEPKKRSCLKRVSDLVEELKELETKSPRKKKNSSVEAATETTKQ